MPTTPAEWLAYFAEQERQQLSAALAAIFAAFPETEIIQ